MHILVTGGAGYIGSHCVRLLRQSGHHVVVVDNLVYGHRYAVPVGVPFYLYDIGDEASIQTVLKKEKIEVVMHFAAYAWVGESVTQPMKYYQNNVVATYRLLQAMLAGDVKKFIFSSSCATYGIPDTLPITEETPQKPINPYGQTKLDVEQALKALARAHDFRFVALRYFNAAGAAEDGSIGEDHTPETHLIPSIIEHILGQRPCIQVFGDDYPTPDGTCLRDYVHVDDLARAHILAIQQLDQPHQALCLNLSTGKPYSVKTVIQKVEHITGHAVRAEIHPRRPGDPPALYADAGQAKALLKWTPQHTTIDTIIQTAWKWHQSKKKKMI